MEATAKVEQLIYIVKERNRYLAALKEIDRIVSTIRDTHNVEYDFNLISGLCKTAIASPRKISTEVNNALLLLTQR